MPRPREPPVFFIDHCLGTEKVAARLRREGVAARVLVDEGFKEDANDVGWLPAVAAKGWAVLTKDKRIRRRPIEHVAIVAAGAGAFVLVAGGLGGDAQRGSRWDTCRGQRCAMCACPVGGSRR